MRPSRIHITCSNLKYQSQYAHSIAHIEKFAFFSAILWAFILDSILFESAKKWRRWNIFQSVYIILSVGKNSIIVIVWLLKEETCHSRNWWKNSCTKKLYIQYWRTFFERFCFVYKVILSETCLIKWCVMVSDHQFREHP